ncbi:class I SAM-dependent methyltransferase, partial [Mesorhizobium sp. M2A.F.Ca.ET.040.01.1.1]
MSLMTVHGVKVPLRPDDVSPVIWQALDNETYEAKEAKWISRAVKPGDRVLELGSGIGIITSLIAQIPDVQVWAFEANPASAALAKRVVDANDLDNVVLLK